MESANAHPLTRRREMAVGNTFGATALSSFGGFWISFAIIFTPGGFEILTTLQSEGAATFADSFGLYLMVRDHKNGSCQTRHGGPCGLNCLNILS